MPKWDAEWQVPLADQTATALFGSRNVSISSGASLNVSLKPQRVELDSRLAGLLPNLKDASITFTLDKTMNVGGNYSVLLAPDSASLARSSAAMQFSVTAADRSVTSSAPLSDQSLAMIQATADAGGTLWAQVRVRTDYNGPGTTTITPSDSIGVRAVLHLTIAVSR